MNFTPLKKLHADDICKDSALVYRGESGTNLPRTIQCATQLPPYVDLYPLQPSSQCCCPILYRQSASLSLVQRQHAVAMRSVQARTESIESLNNFWLHEQSSDLPLLAN